MSNSKEKLTGTNLKGCHCDAPPKLQSYFRSHDLERCRDGVNQRTSCIYSSRCAHSRSSTVTVEVSSSTASRPHRRASRQSARVHTGAERPSTRSRTHTRASTFQAHLQSVPRPKIPPPSVYSNAATARLRPENSALETAPITGGTGTPWPRLRGQDRGPQPRETSCGRLSLASAAHEQLGRGRLETQTNECCARGPRSGPPARSLELRAHDERLGSPTKGRTASAAD